MAMPAGAATRLLSEAGGRSFALLDQNERARLTPLLRPLPWIDGLIAAVIISPAEPDDWADHVYGIAAPEELELSQEDEIASVIDDHFTHVVDTLYDDPEAYRPYLNGASDQVEAAAQWAAGFRFGIRLLPEPWAPILDNEDARALLAAIFSIEKDEDMPEAERAESPFRHMSADQREHMRMTALEVLPILVLALHAFSFDLEDTGDIDLDLGGENVEAPQEPYVRAAPKVGRNDPCPCGSGKKYKKCCLGE